MSEIKSEIKGLSLIAYCCLVFVPQVSGGMEFFMNGTERMLWSFMEGSSKRFVIPVYQRNYDWQLEQCKQLYTDLLKLIDNKYKSHFFGSIVAAKDENSGMEEYLIIDGQQRLTTVSLLLMAMYNLISEKKVIPIKPLLKERIMGEYLVDKYQPEESKMKLKPIKDDALAFINLLGPEKWHIRASNITVNYNYFYNRILADQVSIDDLFDAFTKLQIISITLGPQDNAQRIFESLNSTGMELSEGDKIRNYILMGVSPTKKQEQYYENYWHKIERSTSYDVSSFVRDYLSVKLQTTPAIKKVYTEFKFFMEKETFKDKEALLKDLVAYAKRYEILSQANTEIDELESVIERLNKFEATVTRPFLMEVLKLAEKNESDQPLITPVELIKIFEFTESYIFRRSICDIPTSSLNKVFVALNKEILRFDGTAENYLEKFKFALQRKSGTGLYPPDKMFADALSTKPIYLMRGKNRQYIMERYENAGTKEVKDVWTLMEKGTYTIEHIMPQTLQNEWKEALGPNFEKIHEEWVHRLANLTLTAYNSKYSNSKFNVKKNHVNGFANSGIRMNQMLAKYDKWTLEEIEDRNQQMVEKALNIWPMVVSSFKPTDTVLDTVTLADDISLKGRRVSKYSFKGAEQTVSSWVEMFLGVLTQLHSDNQLVLLKLAADKSTIGLSAYVSDTPSDKSTKLDEGIFVWTNSNTDSKLSLLRKIFVEYDIEEEELVFFLLNPNEESIYDSEESNIPERHVLRKKFWSQAVPVLRERTKRFENVNPTISNWLSTYVGRTGINISAVVNFDLMKVELYIGTKDPELNDRIFEYIFAQKDEIENSAQSEFHWINEPDIQHARIGIKNSSLGLIDAELWDENIDFLANGVNKIANHILPKLESFYEEHL